MKKITHKFLAIVAVFFVLLISVSAFGWPLSTARAAAPIPIQGSDSNTWRIIRGTVGSSGLKIAGGGFRVTSHVSGSGTYTIRFGDTIDQPFYLNPPTVFASLANQNVIYYISTFSESTGGFTVQTWQRTIDGAGYAADAGFSFIAIGRQSSNTSCSFERLESGQMQIIRGRVGSSGSVAAGEGFSASGSGGVYTVVFTAPFSSRPTIVVGVDATNGYSSPSAQPRYLATSGESTGSFRLNAYNNWGSAAGTNFSFIAIGNAAASASCPVYGIETNPLRLAYGRILSGGPYLSGSGAGISSIYNALGDRTISYTDVARPFIDDPAPLVAIDSGNQGFTTTNGGTSISSIKVFIWNQAEGEGGGAVYAGNKAIAFIAVGPILFPPDAQPYSDNIPTSFTANEQKTVGADGEPLRITMKNLGVTWTSNSVRDAAGTGTGTCQEDRNADGVSECPYTTNAPGTSCTVQRSNWSTVYRLDHITSNFVQGATDPAYYDKRTSQTCTVISQPCSNPSPSCQTSFSACTSAGTCSVGGCSNPASCQMSPAVGGCGGTWTVGCNGTWTSGGKGISKVTSGDPNVPVNTTADFFINSLIAPPAAGTYTESWRMNKTDTGTLFGTQFNKVITVMAAIGTVRVNSVNSVTGAPVWSSWTFPLFPSTDPCSLPVGCTNLTNATYTNMLAGMYTNKAVLGSAGPLHVFRDVSSNLADIKIGNFFAFDLVKDLFIKVAKAVYYSPPCPPGQFLCTLTLAPASTIMFALNWDPVARMGIQNVTSPILPPFCADGEICLSDAEPNGASVTIRNTGAGGSELNWSVSNKPSWLNISTPAPVDSGESQTVAITYNNSMPRGTDRSIGLEFDGTSSPGDRLAVDTPKFVTVNLSIPIPLVGLTRIAPTTPSVVANTNAIFTASGGMGTTYSWSVVSGPAAANPQSGNLNGEGSTFTTKFMLVGPYVVKLTDTDPGNYGQYTTVNVPVTAPAASCTFSANPPSVVLLESTTLSWSCANINPAGICYITGIGPNPLQVSCTGGPPCSGSVVVTPTSTTSYVLSCTGVFGGATTTIPLPINVQRIRGGEIPP